ncbi:MAG: 2-hydroxychromene-2-carboxylate isomerase [Rubrivivax sp.]|jgi:2-hydroxychromene-2-carboxylate isomerase|nr:2-hydroxychromene-2-carboxylate isomerase [Rubrivivax sp.]
MPHGHRSVEFVYDFVSVPSYIAWKALPPMLAAARAELVTTPVLCGGIFKATGNPGPLAIEAKRIWYQRDLELWARRRGVTLILSPFVPVTSLHLMRGSLVAAERGETGRCIDAVFDALYVQARDLGQKALFAAALAEAGLDRDAYLAGIERAEVKQALIDRTNDAVARGAFGVPTFFVDGELFFGQDRLEFVIEALQALPG